MKLHDIFLFLHNIFLFLHNFIHSFTSLLFAFHIFVLSSLQPPQSSKYLGGISQSRDVDVDAVTLHYVLLLWMTGKKNSSITLAKNSSKSHRIPTNRQFPLSLGSGSKKFLPKPAYNIHALRNLPDIPVHLTGRARTTLQELLQYAKPMNIHNPKRTRETNLKKLRHKTILGRKLSNIFRKQHYQRLKRWKFTKLIIPEIHPCFSCWHSSGTLSTLMIRR